MQRLHRTIIVFLLAVLLARALPFSLAAQPKGRGMGGMGAVTAWGWGACVGAGEHS